MIERKLHYELVSKLKEGGQLPALVYVKNGFDLYFAERNFKIIKRYPIVNAVGVNLDFNTAMKLSSVDGVDYIAAESKVSTLDDVNDIEKISIDEAIKTRNKTRPVYAQSKKVSTESLSIPPDMDGKGVGLCVLDTGVMPHLDLWLPSQKLTCFKDVLNEKEEPYDDNGHGTFVAGVALGTGIMSAKKVSGVASGANLISVKAINENGVAGAFKILDGMQWILDNRKKQKIDVVCMSFGAEPEAHDPLCIGAETLVKNGICVVAASGNSGKDSIKSPAVSPYVISVGAVDDDYKVAEFTSTGTVNGQAWPDVYAKGVKIAGLGGSGYVKMSGTSVAAPYIAAACCLLKQRYPDLSPLEIKRIILREAEIYKYVKVLEFLKRPTV